MTENISPILSTEQFKNGLFVQVPRLGNQQAVLLRNKTSNTLLHVTNHTTTAEIFAGKYDEIIRVDLSPRNLTLTMPVPSKNQPYHFTIETLVSIQITDPEYIYTRKITNLQEYICDTIAFRIKEIARRYGLLEKDQMDEEIQYDFAINDRRAFNELEGVRYQLKAVLSYLPADSAEVIKQITSAEIDQAVAKARADSEVARLNSDDQIESAKLESLSKLQNLRQKHAKLILNPDMVTAVFEQVLTGAISREQAIQRISESQRNIFSKNLDVVIAMRSAGINEEQIQALLEKQILPLLSGINLQLADDIPLLSRDEALKKLDAKHRDCE